MINMDLTVAVPILLEVTFFSSIIILIFYISSVFTDRNALFLPFAAHSQKRWRQHLICHSTFYTCDCT